MLTVCTEYIIRVQRVGTNRCQEYVPTLFVENKSTEGGYY